MNAPSIAPLHLAGKFLRRLTREGPASVCGRVFRRCRDAAREWRLGVDTGGSIHRSLFTDNAEHFGYQPIAYDCCNAALDRVAIEPDRDVFADFGCGKGRAVLLAAQRAFQSVWGVELSGQLAQTARDNVRRASRHLRCNAVRIVEQDATRFEIPDTLTVAFFYNPFAGDVLRRVLDRLHASVQRRPRNLRIIYAIPRMDRDLMAETPWLEPADELHTANSDWQRLTIYAVSSKLRAPR